MKLYIYIIAIVCATLMTSCSTTEKITIIGTPNTNIYTPRLTNLGTIGASGKLEVELTSDAYYAFLLSQDPTTNQLIPFALDYKKHRYTNTKIACALGYTMFFGQCLAAVDNPAIQIGGSAAALLGIPLAWIESYRLMQIDHKSQFTYLETQTANGDITFTKPTYQNQLVAQQSEDSKKTSDKDTTSDSSKAKIKTSQQSTKSLKNWGAQIEGKYNCVGQLTQNGTMIEDYSKMTIKITRIDDKTVSVTVYDDNGDSFFEDETQYTITKNSNGTFDLAHSSIKSATIKITKGKTLTYLHPRVNIDGDIYTLKAKSK